MEDLEVYKKENTHLVVKWDAIEKALSPEDYLTFLSLLSRVTQYIGSDKKYLVVNLDEPYASEIQQAILEGEHNKQLKLKLDLK